MSCLGIKEAIDQFVRLMQAAELEVVGHTVSMWEMFWYFAALSLLIWLISNFWKS